jgi:hypothetical protein
MAKVNQCAHIIVNALILANLYLSNNVFNQYFYRLKFMEIYRKSIQDIDKYTIKIIHQYNFLK